jgi:predicted transcriptional regulator
LSTKVERHIQIQTEWRRSKVAELDSQGHSQPEIAKILQVSIGTVNRDLSILRQQAKENIKRYIDERLPEEYGKCLVGLNAITKEAWNAAQSTLSLSSLIVVSIIINTTLLLLAKRNYTQATTTRLLLIRIA